MRKKSKMTILITCIVFAILLLSTGGVYYYQAAHISELKRHYLLDIEALTNSKTTAYVLVRDMKYQEILKAEDVMKVAIDQSGLTGDQASVIEEVVGKALKIDLKANQVLSQSLLYEPDQITDDIRDFELSAAFTPSYIQASDYVDVRINFMTGMDYVVLSKKRIESILKSDDQGQITQYLRFKINADEILRLSSAIVDAFYKKGTYIYVIKYTSPDIQKAAVVNYPVNPDVRTLILSDPNIVERAQLSLQNESRASLMSSFATYGVSEVRQIPSPVMSDDQDKQQNQSFKGEGTETELETQTNDTILQ